VIRTVVVVVVAVVVVAIPVVVDAVHDDHPFRLDPFPRAERANAPQRNGRPRAIVRMARDVVAVDTGRRIVVWRWTGVFMPCDGRLVNRAGRSGMMCRAGPGSRPCGGIVSRPCGGIVSRPCSGIVSRPCGGIVSGPCSGMSGRPCGTRSRRLPL
jgi:hypothetical protein